MRRISPGVADIKTRKQALYITIRGTFLRLLSLRIEGRISRRFAQFMTSVSSCIPGNRNCRRYEEHHTCGQLHSALAFPKTYVWWFEQPRWKQRARRKKFKYENHASWDSELRAGGGKAWGCSPQALGKKYDRGLDSNTSHSPWPPSMRL